MMTGILILDGLKVNRMNIAKAQQLKGLQTRLSKLEGDCKSLAENAKQAQKDHHSCLNRIKAIKTEIESFIEKEIIVTEHAVLRYLERVMGFDMALVSKSILTDDVKLMISKMGDGKYPIDGAKIIVKNNTIVSVTN